MTNTQRQILVHAQEVKLDNKKFITCSAEINKKWYKIKFTQDCEGAPKKRGLYDLIIDFDDCSIERGKQYTRKDGTIGINSDTIWVRKIVNNHQWSDDELTEANRVMLQNIFGD